ncbi:MAG: enoyl-CoA hydratase, partial [Deltaproteobacteria bacterium]
LDDLGKPSIAAVNGMALGGGCELALACSFRIASKEAKFGLPEVKLGIIPGWGGTQRLARLVGKEIAMRLVLTGKIIDADEAYRIGLVTQVVPPEELIPACEALAGEIAKNSPVAVKLAMEAIQEGCQLPLTKALILESTLAGLSCMTKDAQERLHSFKRRS